MGQRRGRILFWRAGVWERYTLLGLPQEAAAATRAPVSTASSRGQDYQGSSPGHTAAATFASASTEERMTEIYTKYSIKVTSVFLVTRLQFILWLKSVALQSKSPGYKISAFCKTSVTVTLVTFQPFIFIYLQFTYLRLSSYYKIRWQLRYEPDISVLKRRF